MKLISGDTLWTKINKIPNKYSYLDTSIDCDVLIIGAGITGALCSYYFSQAGVDTVIVDKNIIGYGSTSASTSILQYEIDTNILGLQSMIGLENAIRAFKLCESAVYEIGNIIDGLYDKCGFSFRDCLYYTNLDYEIKMLKKECELRKQNGFDVDFYEGENAANKFKIKDIKAAIYSKKGAGEIDPYRFSHALIAASIKNGLRVFENTNVCNIDTNNNGLSVATNNGFKINAKKVVIAKGFEARRYIEDNIVKLSRSFTIATKPIDEFCGWYNRCIIRDTSDTYTYIRTTLDNRIIIGGEDIDVGGDRSSIANLLNDDKAALQKYDILENKLREFFYDIPDLEVEYRFSGIFGDTKDGLPYIGEYSKIPNCYFCLGYGSNGILYAQIGAKLLCDFYLGKEALDLKLFKFER